MSRIHEALKKAEQERATIATAETAVAPFQVESAAEATVAPTRNNEMPLQSGDMLSRTVVTSRGSGEYLRFDDLRARCVHPVWHLDPNVNVFVNADSTTGGSEQFRTLRSRLYQMRSNQPLRTLLVTSSIPTEGKTFVTSNLAQAIVRQPDRRALIIDADLRRSRLHVPLGAPSSPGLTDYLRGCHESTCYPSDAIQLWLNHLRVCQLQHASTVAGQPVRSLFHKKRNHLPSNPEPL